MLTALLNILDLDGYRSLICKFTDHSTISWDEHHWTAELWRDAMFEMLKRAKIRLAWRLRRAWYLNDWDTMYEMLLEWYQIEEV